MNKYKIIVIVLSVLLVGIFAVGFFYNWGISAMSRDDEPVEVEIKEGKHIIFSSNKS